MKNKKAIAVWVVVIIVGLFVGREIFTNETVRDWLTTPHPNDLVEKTPGVFVRYGVPARPTPPQSGVVSQFIPGHFVPVAENWDPTKILGVRLVTDGPLVKCTARLDGRRIVPLFAVSDHEKVTNEEGSSTANLTIPAGFNRIEIMIDPVQKYSYSQFEARWNIRSR